MYLRYVLLIIGQKFSANIEKKVIESMSSADILQRKP
jgi:hypothetical protein